jgi:hypothetical protein
MASSSPLGSIQIVGDSTMRGVTLALPSDLVRDFLPRGLDLATQNVTRAGTHPVVLLFDDMFRVQLSVPTLFPNMTYHEHSVGVPYCYLSGGYNTSGFQGPFYFMPKLYLDDWCAILGGRLFWGFPKEMASFTVTADRYTVTSLGGQRLASFRWKDGPGGFQPLQQFGFFKPTQAMLSQPLISLVPFSMGPFFVVSKLERLWSVAMLNPVAATLDVEVAYVQGYQCGHSSAAGIDSSVLGSYEIRVPWRLSMAYPSLP